MPLKKRLIDSHRFDGRALVLALKTNDPVDHQEGVAMRQDAHHFVHIQHRFSGGQTDRRRHQRIHPPVTLSQLFRHFRIRPVPGLHRNDMTHDSFARKHQVTNQIQNLMTRQFLRKTKRFLRQNSITTENDGIFQTPPFD